MTWTIEYAELAAKALRKLDPAARKRIRDLLEVRIAGSDDPRLLGKALSGPLAEYWRYRVGDYGIICEIRDRKVVILVLKIGNRRDVYRRQS